MMASVGTYEQHIMSLNAGVGRCEDHMGSAISVLSKTLGPSV
jgi:hypothetical protein